MFKVKKIETPSLGSKLREERESQKISLEDLASATKIQQRYLNYLELEQYEKLPADIYVRGFLIKYATYLGLDFQPIIEQYSKERHVSLKVAKKKEHAPLPILSNRNIIITPKTIGILLVSLIFLGALVYLIFQWSNLVVPPRLELTVVGDEEIFVNKSSFLLEGLTGANNSLTINDKKIYIETNGSFKQTVELTPGGNIFKLVAKNRIGLTAEKRVMINYQKNE